MSVPHTGRLVADVLTHRVHFDGDRWTTPEGTAVAWLNRATENIPKTHFDIRELAERVLRAAGVWDQSRVIEWRGDAWREDLPSDMVD